MTSTRLEAFSDAVIAIIMTIMVLELKIPEGNGGFGAFHHIAPAFLAYVLSFVFIAIYWVNHHHMMHVTEKVTGAVLWANMHLLFWLSLIPATTAWIGANPMAKLPAATYGVVMLACAISYTVLQNCIIAVNGRESVLKDAVGSDTKGKVSMLLYASAIPLAYVHPWISYAIYVVVAGIWLVPDRRIEKQVDSATSAQSA